MNDFNRIAWFYDALAKLVFRGNILKSQTQFIHLIRSNDKILIAGGGSGKVLEVLDRLKIPIFVDFVEPSYQMIEKAKSRQPGLSSLNIKFHQQPLESFKNPDAYDWVFCFYFFDLFDRESLYKTLDQVKGMMKRDAYLMVADFQNIANKLWQRGLLKVMHIFFGLTSDLQSKGLKNIREMVEEREFAQAYSHEFFDELIFSAVYKKNVSKNGNHS